MMEKRSVLPGGGRLSPIFLWLMIPFVIGLMGAYVLIPVPRIGVIRLEGEIFDSLADYIGEQLAYAQKDPTIRAVVLKINSPGGGVTASESLHYNILSFREAKPLVVSIDTMAASGAYYAACAGDWIYGKPSSSVGNVGVVSFLPLPTYVDEEMITTGPFKLFGSSRSRYTREMELLKQGFLRAVKAQRGDRLKLSEEALSRGELYVGMQAVELGVIDQLGTLTDAAERAAQLAKVAHYQLIELQDLPGLKPPPPPPLATAPEGKAGTSNERLNGLYYLYPNGEEVGQ